MTEDEFNDKFIELQDAFEHKIKSQSARQYWHRVRSYGVYIWHDAIELIITHDDRFPRITRILEVLEEMRFKKKQDEALQRKHGSWSSPADILLAIPFPPDLKDALKAKMDGRITQEQLEQICKAHEPENTCPYRCIDGWVRYWKQIQGHGKRLFTAKCSCVKGQALAEPGPTVDEIGLPGF